MSITLTESAAEHVKKMLQKQRQVVGLRLGTRKSGCTGFAYVVDYADEVKETDKVFNSRGVNVVIDSQSMPMLDGLTLDFVRENVLNEGFEFINPNVREQCGCGESFNV